MAISQLPYASDYLFNYIIRDKLNLVINTLNLGIPVNSVVVVGEPSDLSGTLDSSIEIIRL